MALRVAGACMRFGYVVVAVVSSGVLTGTAIEQMFPPAARTVSAVRALGADPSKVSVNVGDFDISKIYADVIKKVTSGHADSSFPAGAVVSTPTFSALPSPFGASGLRIDSAGLSGAWASSLNAQMQQNNIRAQDFRAYANNPMAWHGVPPQ